MKNIVLYAPPAAGKGTQCEFLEKEYGYKVISIGQVLRNQRSTETEVGRIIIETQDKGVLAPDDIVAKALKLELDKYQDCNIVIEGYPRNIDQAHLLDTVFDNYIVINLAVDRETAMKRTLGRVNCPSCGKIYNIYFDETKPMVNDVCDVCHSKLNSRSDDNEKSFNVRFDVYEENAPAIIDYYKNQNKLYIVDSSVNKDYTANQIKDILENENIIKR